MPFSPAGNESMVAWIHPIYLWELFHWLGRNGERLCKCRRGSGALCQYLRLYEPTEVRQGVSEMICMYFVLCADFFAPGFNSRFSFSFITCGLTQSLPRALAETSWGADSRIPFIAPALTLFAVGGCCPCSSLTLLPVVPPRPLCAHSNCFVKQTKPNQTKTLHKGSLQIRRYCLCADSPRLHATCFPSTVTCLLLVWCFWKPMKNIHSVPGRV